MRKHFRIRRAGPERFGLLKEYGEGPDCVPFTGWIRRLIQAAPDIGAHAGIIGRRQHLERDRRRKEEELGGRTGGTRIGIVPSERE